MKFKLLVIHLEQTPRLPVVRAAFSSFFTIGCIDVIIILQNVSTYFINKKYFRCTQKFT